MSERKTRYCSNCGEEIDTGAEICPECGARVESSSLSDEYLDVGMPTELSGADALTRVGALAGGMVTVIGLFLPWFRIGVLETTVTTMTGLDFSGGVLILMLSLFVMGLVYFGDWSRGIGGLTLFLGVLMLLSLGSIKIPSTVIGMADMEFGAGLASAGIILVIVSGTGELVRGD